MADPESQGGQKRYRKSKTEGTNDSWGNMSLDGKTRTADQKEKDSAPLHSLLDKFFGTKK